MRHDVAPVARRVPNGEEDRNLTFGGLGKRAIRPRPPVHWIRGVLEQIRAGRGGEAVTASHALVSRHRAVGLNSRDRAAALMPSPLPLLQCRPVCESSGTAYACSGTKTPWLRRGEA